MTYTNKYQSHVDSRFGYKLVGIDDQFSKPFQSYLETDPAHKKIFCSFLL